MYFNVTLRPYMKRLEKLQMYSRPQCYFIAVISFIIDKGNCDICADLKTYKYCKMAK